MRYYPIFLDLRGRCCTVVGGGRVAERKVLALLRAGASVRVISPKVTPRLTLNYGLRWEYDPIMFDYGSNEANFDPDAYTSVNTSTGPQTVRGVLVVPDQKTLSFVNPDLAKLEQAYVLLAGNEDESAKAFKDRYYFYGTAFSVQETESKDQVPMLLYWVLSDMPASLHTP